MLRLPFLKTPRNLFAADLEAAWVARRFWEVSVEKLPDLPYRDPFLSFYTQLPHIAREGVGLVLIGPYSSGKTSLAVCAIKRVLAWGGTALFCPAGSVIDAVIAKPAFDTEYSLLERVHGVDLLVIDDLGSEAVTDGGNVCIEKVVRFRTNNRASVIITTNLKVENLKARYPGIAATLKGLTGVLNVSGKDWRAEEEVHLKDLMGWH